MIIAPPRCPTHATTFALIGLSIHVNGDSCSGVVTHNVEVRRLYGSFVAHP